MPDLKLTSRPSSCANQSLQAEIARVHAMTVEERIHAALSMKEKFTWLQPTAIEKNGAKPS